MSFFPHDAITYNVELSGPVTDFFYTNGTSTVLGFSFQQSANNSVTEVRCGTDTLGRNYAKDRQFVPISYVCDQNLNITKTGNDDADVIVVYVPYDLSLVPEYYIPSDENIATTSDVYITGNITSGDIVNSALLFIVLIVLLCGFIAQSLNKIKTKKTFLGYGGGDVEIRDDL